jgi:TatD DNase family protein
VNPPLPPLDLHTHVSPDISADELEVLGAVIFAVTRSEVESRIALARSDRAAVWGAGTHPGLVRAQKAYAEETFRELVSRTPFVGEVGLDASSRVDNQLQLATLRSVLSLTHEKPRIVSLHSYGAAAAVLEVLSAYPNKGAVLHWWLGDAEETARAISLGCYFSVNPSSVREEWRLKFIPLTRLLTETDHPSGDRSAGRNARPGNVDAVERAIASVYGITQAQVRWQIWVNFATLVRRTTTFEAMPVLVRRIIQSLST